MTFPISYLSSMVRNVNYVHRSLQIANILKTYIEEAWLMKPKLVSRPTICVGNDLTFRRKNSVLLRERNASERSTKEKRKRSARKRGANEKHKREAQRKSKSNLSISKKSPPCHVSHRLPCPDQNTTKMIEKFNRSK